MMSGSEDDNWAVYNKIPKVNSGHSLELTSILNKKYNNLFKFTKKKKEL